MIEERKLGAAEVAGTVVLGALAEGAGPVRIFLGAGTDPRQVTHAPGLVVSSVLSVNKSLMVRGEWSGDEALPLPLAGAGAAIEPVAPELDLFETARVLMGERNGQSAEVVRDWLAHHAREGFEAALLLDRARPGEPPLVDLLRAAMPVLPPGLRRVVVVVPECPLGGPGASERHALQAPDAPGKDRMEIPADDPWTAPMGQMIVWEALRWRFLARASAVAFLDVSDLLLPMPEGHGALDLLDGASPAIVPLGGRRTYPWRVRAGREPSFGDHVCDQFDQPGGNRRWLCDPRAIPEGEPFRLVRIGGINPDPMRAGYFLRAMALRCTEAGSLPLAPKSGLVLDDLLLTLARDRFGADPVLPPVSDAGQAPGLPAALPGRTAIVTCMKNEGPFVLEWIAYHRVIGVDDFLVYTNDCTDGTDTLLDLLQDHGIVQHRENPFRQMTDVKPQHAALAAAESEAIMARAGWAICMDVDEFINVHAGAGHLRDLYRAVGDANMISLTWRLFGNSDLDTYEDVPTPARFDRCAPEVIRKPHQAWGFKTLFRNLGIYKKMGVHRPKGLRPDLWEETSWVNGSGMPMPREMLRNGWRSTIETYGYELVTLNHYAVRDAESFLVKRDRGRVNHVERDQGLGYWFRMNNNAEADRSIRRMLPALDAELTRLKALPGVGAQHESCVAAHRARIAELRSSDAFADFYEEITGPRMRRLSRMHRHFGANVFLAGPDCVPDEVISGDPSEDFFFTVGEVDETTH